METLNKMLNKNVYFYIEENNLYKQEMFEDEIKEYSI